MTGAHSRNSTRGAWLTFLSWWVMITFAAYLSPLRGEQVRVADRQFFDLPASDAEASLNRFSLQSGLEVLFASQVAVGVIARAVRGEYTAMEALSLLLEGSGLEAAINEGDGVLTIKRSTSTHMTQHLLSKVQRTLSSALLAMAARGALPAQDKSSSQTTEKEEEVIHLSPFIVKQETDSGYKAQQTLVGSRTAKNLMEIPSSIQIINRELLDDLSAINVHQALKYAVSGVTQNQVINSDVNIRGFRGGALIDGVGSAGNKHQPMYAVERLEVLKGPAAMLLGTNVLGGAVNFITLSAGGTPSGNVKTTFSDDKYIRLEATSVGPLFKSNDFRLNYRVTVGGHRGEGPKEVMKFDEKYLGGGLSMYFGERSSLTINAYYFQDHNILNYWWDFLDARPSTKDAAGLMDAKLNPNSTEDFAPSREKNNYWRDDSTRILATYLARLTENGNLRVAYTANKRADWNDWAGADGIAADNYTMLRGFYGAYGDSISHTGQLDYLHRWMVKNVVLDTTIGVDGTRSSSDSKSNFRTMPSLDTRVRAFPEDDAFFAQPPPAYSSIRKGTATNFSYYAQENVSFWKNRITLVGGLRWFKSDSTSSNLRTSVNTVIDNPRFRVHKYGVVFKPLPSLSIYYTNAENINQQTGFVDLDRQNDGLGGPLQDQQGVLDEFGVKFDYAVNDRMTVYGSAAIFDQSLTNVRTFGTLRSGQQGLIQSAQDSAKGWETDLGMRANFSQGFVDVIVSYFDGESSIAADNEKPAAQKREAVDFTPWKYSLLAKYTGTRGVFQRLTVGGGLMDQDRKRNGAYWVDIPLTASAFASYKWDRQWQFQLNVDNLTDKRYIVKVNSVELVQTSDRLSAKLSGSFKW